MPKFDVQRSIEISASPDQVFDVVSNFNTWSIWSPWLIADPQATVTVSNDASSVGSLYQWSGDVCGAGEVEHVRLEQGRLIGEEIRFLKPFKSRSDVGFQIEPRGNGCRLTWSMHGSMPFLLFWMLPQMKTMIGMDYDRGLKMLKEWIETGRIESKVTVHGVEEVGPFRIAGVRSRYQLSECGDAMQRAFCESSEKLDAVGIPKDGPVMSVYHDVNLKNGVFDCTSGFSIPEAATEIPASLSVWSTGSVKAFRVEHVGSYDHMGNGWSAAHQIVRHRKHKMSKRMGAFEIYRNNPADTPPAELRADIYLPLK